MVGKRKKEKREQKPHFGSRFLIHINNNVKKKKNNKNEKEHAHREASALANELPEESEQF
jgi:hypothetical protein